MKMSLFGAAFSCLFALSLGCDQGSKDAKREDKASASAKASGGSPAPSAAPTSKPTATTDKSAAPPSTALVSANPETGNLWNADVTHPNLGTPQAPVTTPAQQTYSMDGIKTISDTCEKAHAILSQAPESVGVDYDWTYSRQAMLANQQYQVVDGSPSVRGQISFQVHQADDKMQKAWVLVANCGDGLTCNHLAAMYKAIVKSSNPQLFCGDVPAYLGPSKKSVNLMKGGPEANLPAESDARAKCGRIAACTIADKTDTKDDILGNCQKSPAGFKLDCARKYPCAEVLACMK